MAPTFVTSRSASFLHNVKRTLLERIAEVKVKSSEKLLACMVVAVAITFIARFWLRSKVSPPSADCSKERNVLALYIATL